MKAIIHSKYGPPEKLQVQEIPQPIPGDQELLIRNYATTVTTSDCNVRNLTFVPKSFHFFFKLLFGNYKPKINILGMDFAGEVASVGSQVTRFKKGDPVFGNIGNSLGTHAEFICIPEDGILTKKPSEFSWEEAAAITQMGNTALYFIRDTAQLQPAQQILINGASGGIGTFAVQLARHYGAKITAVCSAQNKELVLSLGADHAIDYTQEDFTQSGKEYDVIFDVAAKSSFNNCKSSLKKGGLYMTTVPNFTTIFQSIRTSLFSKKKVKFGDAVPTFWP
jgi:NADPH:quinone reductase-like Zn-dependent oxidoreductase